jgi:ubiquinone biosynthesis protein UbiJ
MPPWRLDFAIDARGYLAHRGGGGESFDVVIVLPADAPMSFFRGGSDEAMRPARISGAADVADALGFVLGRLRWDFEDDLSKLVGNIAAHRIAGMLVALASWQRQASRHLGENLSEYLTEENTQLVRAEDLGEFTAAVGRLEDDLAALERRLYRLGRTG